MDVQHDIGIAGELLTAGDRTGARQVLHQVVHLAPHCTTAWLWLSGLVDTVEQQRTCLLRALASDPACALAREGLLVLWLRDLLADQLAGAPSQMGATSGIKARRSDTSHAYVRVIAACPSLPTDTPPRCTEVSHTPVPPPCGVRTYRIAPHLQAPDGSLDIPMPQRLGEYLVLDQIITPEQLIAALTHQATLQRVGYAVRIGAILIQHGWITPMLLNRFLAEQRQPIWIT